MKLLRKNVLLILSHRQFNDDEYAIVREILESEGCRVKVAAASIQPAIGMRGTQVRPQMLFSDVRAGQYDAAVFIGGNGARDFWAHPRAHNLIRDFDAYGKILAAICLAPVTLARTGLLKDRTATCHPSAMKELVAAGAKYLAEPVCVSEKMITANGPQSARQFAEALVGMLSKEE